jgi:hypothetical protein
MALECTAFCDPGAARMMDQAMGKFSERAGFANAAAMDLYNQMSTPIMAEALNTMQAHGMASAILALDAVSSP